MSTSFPENVENLVKAGIRSGNAADKYMALGAANRSDWEHYGQSQYGVGVVHAFLDQADVALRPAGEPIATRGWGEYMAHGKGDYMRRGELLLRREVVTAIGDEIGVSFKAYELIGKNPNPNNGGASIAVTEEGFISGLAKYFSPEEPYVVMDTYLYASSRGNLLAVMGVFTGSSVDDRNDRGLTDLDDLSLEGASFELSKLAETDANKS